MTNQEILEKAIAKAIDNGWDTERPGKAWNTLDIYNFYEVDKDPDFAWLLIYRHDFAKALWGEDWPNKELLALSPLYASDAIYWKYRLQQMVISDDPVKYLGQNL